MGQNTSTESLQSQLSLPQPIASHNSPIAYGLGAFGLESLGTVFTGFYMFYYIDELGLAVAMAAIVNIIYAIWDAVNDPLVLPLLPGSLPADSRLKANNHRHTWDNQFK